MTEGRRNTGSPSNFRYAFAQDEREDDFFSRTVVYVINIIFENFHVARISEVILKNGKFD